MSEQRKCEPEPCKEEVPEGFEFPEQGKTLVLLASASSVGVEFNLAPFVRNVQETYDDCSVSVFLFCDEKWLTDKYLEDLRQFSPAASITTVDIHQIKRIQRERMERREAEGIDDHYPSSYDNLFVALLNGLEKNPDLRVLMDYRLLCDGDEPLLRYLVQARRNNIDNIYAYSTGVSCAARPRQILGDTHAMRMKCLNEHSLDDLDHCYSPTQIVDMVSDEYDSKTFTYSTQSLTDVLWA